MRKSAHLFLLSLILTGSIVAAPQQDTPKKKFTYEQVFSMAGMMMGRGGDNGITGRLPSVTGWLDADTYLETRMESGQRRTYAVNATTGESRIYRDAGEDQKNLPAGFSLQGSAASMPELGRHILIHEDDLYFYDVQSKKLRRLTATPSREENPRFSPNGNWVAYTRDHNLFAYDLENSVEHQYTTDGSDSVYNGWASWVYFEEILGRGSQYAAFWWSPDSTRLAFMRFDDAPVPAFPIYHAGGQHGELERQRYPKAGDPNPYVSMGMVPVSQGKVTWADFDPKADHYIAWPSWTPDSKTLTVQWMNRGQDTIRLYNCDPESGKKTQIFEEKQPSWVSFFEDLTYLRDGSFLLRTDVDGWDHLYLYAKDGGLKKRLTSGSWRVGSIERVDEESGYVYFSGRPTRTWDTQLMRVKLDGTGLQQLTNSDGSHRSQVSPGGKWFVDTVSSVTSPGVMNLHDGSGKIVRQLGDSRKATMDEYAWGKAEMFTIPSGDGFDLPAYWVLPVDFDPSRQYPVIFSIYGGPDAGTVRNSWLGLTPHYWAQRGVITISVDHRGSGHFGKKGVALMHRNLGKWEMADLITATRWLRSKPFSAKDRIGITGSSYGGYTTLMALTFGAEHFNFGQAGSSVSDWKLYDSVYTERYMDTPAENPQGYKDGAVLTWASRYRGGLKITHGTTDDNVHMQNSIQVVDWLTSNNKHFELMIYPESRHGIQAGQRAHLSREAHDFWMRHLLGQNPGDTGITAGH
jgi:dipeptidyl-peptidase 4